MQDKKREREREREFKRLKSKTLKKQKNKNPNFLNECLFGVSKKKKIVYTFAPLIPSPGFRNVHQTAKIALKSLAK